MNYTDAVKRLRAAGFDLLHEGVGFNVQQTGSEKQEYIVYLPYTDTHRRPLDAIAADVLRVFPEYTSARAVVKTYRGITTQTEIWVYLS